MAKRRRIIRRGDPEAADGIRGVRDRVVELVKVPASTLIPSNLNWRVHNDPQRRAIRGLMEDIGFADVLLARRNDDGELELIDGHLRREEMEGRDVPVVVLDLTEMEANKLMLTLDPIASMAEADPNAFRQLLDTVQTENEVVAELLTTLAESFDVIPDIPGNSRPPEPDDLDHGSSDTVHTCPNCGHSFKS